MSKLIFGQDVDNFYKHIYLDYGKKEKEVKEYVDILLKWCQAQPHFPEIPAKNVILLTIVGSKFSIERSKEKLDMYYTIRGLMPEIFTKHPLSPDVIAHSKVLYVVPFPKVSSNQHRIFYAQLNPEFGPEDFKHEFFMIQFTHLLELIFQEDKCYTFSMIFSCAGAKLGHVSRLNPMCVKKMALCLEKVYASRIKTIYVVDFYPFLEPALNTIIRPFIPSFLEDKVKFFDNADILFKDFDKSIIPSDLGGDEKSLKMIREMLFEKYQEYKPRFDKLQHMTVDESLRPTKLENDDILGYYGSFKQINVD